MGFIHGLLLPKEVDFNAALRHQADIAADMVNHLYDACAASNQVPIPGNPALQAIESLSAQSRETKSRNMAELLDVFITPYDKESIYRMVVQLDWVALSVNHFRLEAEVYDIHSLREYEPILANLKTMIAALQAALGALDSRDIAAVADANEQIHVHYDQVVGDCARATASLMRGPDLLRVIRHQVMFQQLKEIAKRIHVTANTLEDMALKVV
ncbi:MAG: hypothetical protein OI74_15140 [Gammaproteobacteria bacterium (ex Lamellibrachia satsuma)]|nr:MAG: hypothetical protein HPY30_00075 [Gammaproteobacteria bacterium (ex Lamellibrachia satsuma)]RRS31221.1 MAG: hypothetical protein OI74_15140 [Gammaproteobacteria bacterium (ex Lamellibrachia satsuma)]RRS33326.1 MAG: hypothetical protein NV67_16480 [Gammaproteobacteria bacterium (ex Lamellibrachia satsuma)]